MDNEPIGVFVDDDADHSNDAGGDAGGDNSGVSESKGETRINGFQSIEPADTAGNTAGNASGSNRTGRRRGRPAGSRNAKTAQASKGNIGSLEHIIGSMHFLMARIFDTPELELNDDESRKYAEALAKVSALYDDKFNPKVVAWMDLLCVTGAIYAPRVIAVNARTKAERSKNRTVNVMPINAQTNAQRPRTADGPPAQASPRPARSPADMFGAEYFGAAIPDAI
jgi:hypothetical protein